MATVTGLTAARMLAIEGASIIGGNVIAGNLILTKQNGTTINAGPVVGATGATGATGPTGPAGTNGTPGAVWRAAAGTPAGTLGVAGDFYINTSTGDYYEKTGVSTYTLRGNLTGPAGSGGTGGSSTLDTAFPVTIGVAMSDETTTITTTGTKAKFRAPYAFTITDVRFSVNTASSSGLPTLNILNGAGVSIFTTKPTIDASELSSQTAATPRVLDATKVNITDDELLTFNLDVTGTGCNGMKVWILGTRSLASSATVPGQVTGLTAVSPNSIANGTTPGQITLTWTAPSNGGSAITGYKIEGKTTAGSTWTTIAASFGGTSTTVTTFDGTTALAVGTSYDFRVSAINAIGTGTVSTTTSGTPRTVPGAPTGLGTTPGSTQVSLAWTAPTSAGGSAITDYLIEYKLTSSGTWLTFTDAVSTTTSAIVTGLTNSSSYDFRVSAINAAGTSIASSTATATPIAGSGSSPTVRGFSYRERNTASTASFTIDPTSTTTASGGFSTRPNGGDLLVLVVHTITLDKTIFNPVGLSGWTMFGSAMSAGAGSIEVYTRVAGGTAGSVTTDTAYTINSGGSNWVGYAHCYAFSGGTGIDVKAAVSTPGASFTVAAPSVTTTVANTTLIVGALGFAGSPTAINQSFGTTQRTQVNMGAGTTLNLWGYCVATKTQAASGATGTNSFTWTASGSGVSGELYTIAVK